MTGPKYHQIVLPPTHPLAQACARDMQSISAQEKSVAHGMGTRGIARHASVSTCDTDVCQAGDSLANEVDSVLLSRVLFEHIWAQDETGTKYTPQRTLGLQGGGWQGGHGRLRGDYFEAFPQLFSGANCLLATGHNVLVRWPMFSERARFYTQGCHQSSAIFDSGASTTSDWSAFDMSPKWRTEVLPLVLAHAGLEVSKDDSGSLKFEVSMTLWVMAHPALQCSEALKQATTMHEVSLDGVAQAWRIRTQEAALARGTDAEDREALLNSIFTSEVCRPFLRMSPEEALLEALKQKLSAAHAALSKSDRALSAVTTRMRGGLSDNKSGQLDAEQGFLAWLLSGLRDFIWPGSERPALTYRAVHPTDSQTAPVVQAPKPQEGLRPPT